MASMLFLLLALVLFLIAAAGVAAGKVNLLAAGLAAWVASALVAQWVK
jgi:hypothetical protein